MPITYQQSLGRTGYATFTNSGLEMEVLETMVFVIPSVPKKDVPELSVVKSFSQREVPMCDLI